MKPTKSDSSSDESEKFNDINLTRRRKKRRPKHRQRASAFLQAKTTATAVAAGNSSESEDNQEIKQLKLLKQTLNLPGDCADDEIPMKVTFGSDLYLKQFAKTNFSSGLPPFDEFFEDNLIPSGNIIEFCGQTESGKTHMIITILLNIIKDNKYTVAYFDTKGNVKENRIFNMMSARKYSQDLQDDIASRFFIKHTNNIGELIKGLEKIPDDEQHFKFVVIDTITVPFYHILSTNHDYNMRIVSRIHSCLYNLVQKNNITVFVANLALHRYKTSESDDGRGDDGSELSSTLSSQSLSQSIKEEFSINEFKPALGEYWSEILNYRFLLSFASVNINPEEINLDFMENPRRITLLEMHDEEIEPKTIILNVSPTGFEYQT